MIHWRTTKTMSQELHHTGYDQEEEYFFRENLRLIEALRRQRELNRRAPARQEKSRSHEAQGGAAWLARLLDRLIRPRRMGPVAFSI